MSANTSPVFSLTPLCFYAELTATTTDKTGGTTTNMKTLVTALSTGNGTKVTQIGCKVEGNSAAGLLLIFITDTSGNNPKLFDEILISSVTSNTTTSTFRAFNSYSDLQLKAGQLIQVGV